MKNRAHILFGVALLSYPIVCAGREHGRNILPGVDMSMHTAEARVRAEGRSAEAIYLLGLRNDGESVPLLREIAAMPIPTEAELKKRLHVKSLQDTYPPVQRRLDERISEWNLRYWESSFAAKAVLTKMKADDYFNDFISQLSTTNFEWKKEIIDDLGYIGDARAIKYLGPLLLDDRVYSTPGGEHAFGRTISGVAAEAMGKILQPPFMDIQKQHPKKTYFFYNEWKQWWKENQGKYK